MRVAFGGFGLALPRYGHFHNSRRRKELAILRWVRLVIQRFSRNPLFFCGARTVSHPTTSRALGPSSQGDRSGRVVAAAVETETPLAYNPNSHSRPLTCLFKPTESGH
jgi:hypothetical protein